MMEEIFDDEATNNNTKAECVKVEDGSAKENGIFIHRLEESKTSLLSTPYLDEVGLVYNPHLKLLCCVQCGCACNGVYGAFSHVLEHEQLIIKDKLLSELKSNDMVVSDIMEIECAYRPAMSLRAPVEGLRVYENGLKCYLCPFYSQSKVRMQWHFDLCHKDAGASVDQCDTCSIQTLFQGAHVLFFGVIEAAKRRAKRHSSSALLNSSKKQKTSTALMNSKGSSSASSSGSDIAQAPEPILIPADEEVYEVEMILDERKRKVSVRGKSVEKKEYFIKWKGYPHEDNQWISDRDMNCPLLVKQYQKRKKEKLLEKKSK